MSSAAIVIGALRVNPFALREAKIVHNFGLSECNRVKTELVKKMWNHKIKSCCQAGNLINMEILNSPRQCLNWISSDSICLQNRFPVLKGLKSQCFSYNNFTIYNTHQLSPVFLGLLVSLCIIDRNLKFLCCLFVSPVIQNLSDLFLRLSYCLHTLGLLLQQADQHLVQLYVFTSCGCRVNLK